MVARSGVSFASVSFMHEKILLHFFHKTYVYVVCSI